MRSDYLKAGLSTQLKLALLKDCNKYGGENKPSLD